MDRDLRRGMGRAELPETLHERVLCREARLAVALHRLVVPVRVPDDDGMACRRRADVVVVCRCLTTHRLPLDEEDADVVQVRCDKEDAGLQPLARLPCIGEQRPELGVRRLQKGQAGGRGVARFVAHAPDQWHFPHPSLLSPLSLQPHAERDTHGVDALAMGVSGMGSRQLLHGKHDGSHRAAPLTDSAERVRGMR